MVKSELFTTMFRAEELEGMLQIDCDLLNPDIIRDDDKTVIYGLVIYGSR